MPCYNIFDSSISHWAVSYAGYKAPVQISFRYRNQMSIDYNVGPAIMNLWHLTTFTQYNQLRWQKRKHSYCYLNIHTGFKHSVHICFSLAEIRCCIKSRFQLMLFWNGIVWIKVRSNNWACYRKLSLHTEDVPGVFLLVQMKIKWLVFISLSQRAAIKKGNLDCFTFQSP